MKFFLKTVLLLPMIPLIWLARNPRRAYYGGGCEGRANKMYDWWHS